MVGRENKRTNNRTTFPAVKKQCSCSLSGSSENRGFEGCRSVDNICTHTRKPQTHRGRLWARESNIIQPRPKRYNTTPFISHTRTTLLQLCTECINKRERSNLVTRVLRLFGQRLVAKRDSGVPSGYEFSRVSPGDQPLAKKHEDSGHEIERGQVPIHPRVYTLTVKGPCSPNRHCARLLLFTSASIV